jgi:uncharacterized protein
MNKVLFSAVKTQFRLNLRGIHGVSHWARVQYHGLKIAGQENARSDVIKLFALLHDSQRLTDGFDPQHGLRAVEYAMAIRNQLFEIDNTGFDLLCEALAEHSDGKTEADVTVQTCWDADRLDLGRIGVYPKTELLCTATAKSSLFIQRAWTLANKKRQ